VGAIVGSPKPLAMEAVRAKSACLCRALMFTRPRLRSADTID
jgi:hypothetical protein